MKTIGIFTTSRAEFGLLSNLVEAIIQEENLEFKLFIGGGHHVESQGKSVDEIKERKYPWIPFDFFLNLDNEKTLTQSMGIELFQLADIFAQHDFDFVCVLGDRIELLPIVQTAIVFRKPIIHLHGGEITEGVLDDQIRHMITKASHLHFAACEAYRQNIIKMGEQPWRVFNVGALGINSITNNNFIPKEELFNKYKLDEKKPTVLLTYHPVTLEFAISAQQQLKNVFQALDNYDFQLLVTAPNFDLDNHHLFEVIEQVVNSHRNYYFVKSLGIKNYQSMLRYVEFVIGNSSSGILEVPFFRIPTVNIGDRQKGRIRHQSIIDTGYHVEEIKAGIDQAIAPVFREPLASMEYKFGDGHAAERIVEVLKNTLLDANLLKKKLEFPYE
jgi:GDP/UDP-N,N'-diacetylbacillosamine 2-epimerase (hydrolysing)